jgi:hypothetical protein
MRPGMAMPNPNAQANMPMVRNSNQGFAQFDKVLENAGFN